MLLFAAAQFGIFFTIIAAIALGTVLDKTFNLGLNIDLKVASSIGIIVQLMALHRFLLLRSLHLKL